jgi:hypothetical protein
MQPRYAAHVRAEGPKAVGARPQPTAPKAAVIRGVTCADGLAIQPFGKDYLVSFAHGLDTRQTANPLYQIRFLLEQASPADSLGRFGSESVWEQISA